MKDLIQPKTLDTPEEMGGEWYLIGILATLAFLCFLVVTALCIMICKRLGGSRRRDDEEYVSRRHHYPYWYPPWEPDHTLGQAHGPWQRGHRLSTHINPVFNPDDRIRPQGGAYDRQLHVGRREGRRSEDWHQAQIPGREIERTTDRCITKTVGNKLVVYVTKCIDDYGGLLVLDNMGISLEVPRGAVSVGETKIITLLLNWDLGDNPEMQNSQALVSPVVFVGPHGIKLNKPCVLSFMHCSFDARHVQVMKSETDLYSAKNWQVMCKPNDKKGPCVLTSDTCKLNINTFTLYTCLTCPPRGELGQKWLQVAVFSEGIKPGIEHQQIRVYFLNKTNCALQWAIHNEAQYGGKLMCPEKLFLLSGTEKDVFVVLTYVSRGWTIVDDSRQERIQYLSIWHGQCPHVSVAFRRENPDMHEFNLNLEVSQDGRENERERIIAQIVQPVVRHEELPTQLPLPRNRTFPQCLRTRLKVMLDVSSPVAKNWKSLAEIIGCDYMIPLLENRRESSPTEEVLTMMEHKAYTLQNLKTLLSEMGRNDAVYAIQEFLDSAEEEPETMQLKPYREAVENENIGHSSNSAQLNDL